MSEQRQQCGNCGTLNETGAQFCMSCGVLLAAYQSPTGALPTTGDAVAAKPGGQTTESQPQAKTSQPEAPPAAEMPPSAEGPIPAVPSDEGEAHKDVASSVDEIFGTMSGAPTVAPAPPIGDESPVERDLTELTPNVAPEETTESAAATVESTTAQPAAVADAGSPPPAAGRSSRSAPPLPRRTSTVPPRSIGSVPVAPRTPPGMTGQRLSATPPQTLIVIGAVLILGSCILGPITSAVDLPFIFEGPAWCAFPVGVIVLVIGVVQLSSRRGNRM